MFFGRRQGDEKGCLGGNSAIKMSFFSAFLQSLPRTRSGGWNGRFFEVDEFISKTEFLFSQG
jgi:hypothetical protein